MSNENYDLILYKLDALASRFDKTDDKLTELGEMVTRHDEKLSVLQTRGSWISGIFAGFIGYILKDKLHF